MRFDKLVRDYVFTDDIDDLGPFSKSNFSKIKSVAINHDLVVLGEVLLNGNVDFSAIWIWERKPSLKTSQGVLKVIQKIYNTRPNYPDVRKQPDEFSIYYLSEKQGNLYRLWWD